MCCFHFNLNNPLGYSFHHFKHSLSNFFIFLDIFFMFFVFIVSLLIIMSEPAFLESKNASCVGVGSILLHPRNADFSKVLLSFNAWCLGSSLPVKNQFLWSVVWALNVQVRQNGGGMARLIWPSVLNLGTGNMWGKWAY